MSPRRVSGERDSSLADPHGGPAATEVGLFVTSIRMTECVGKGDPQALNSKTGLFGHSNISAE